METLNSVSPSSPEIVHLSSKKFLALCVLLAGVILALSHWIKLPVPLIGIEVLLTVLSLFIFGSIKYRLDKNVITYGAALVILATFWSTWWEDSGLRQRVQATGFQAWTEFGRRYLLTLHGWDELIHADTMLFILGLTFFVATIAQTRLLETVSFSVLGKNKGKVVPTIATLAAIVAFASGILDGVSMIGLMIRVLVLILFLAKAKDEAVLYAVMVSTVVTTVCGMWLAYGEPPNLIMKANLHPHLNNAFFLRYCMPAAVGSYFIVYWNIRKRLRGKLVATQNMDLIDLHTADVRFLQASRHGEVLLAAEFIDTRRDLLGTHFEGVDARLHQGEPLGTALIRERVPAEIRQQLLGAFVAENLAADLDLHYEHREAGNFDESDAAEKRIRDTLHAMRGQRVRAQIIGGLAFIPFVGLLVWHAIDHEVPLFFASFAGFLVASLALLKNKNMRGLALREGKHEYAEYLFLLPLFFSITLLQKSGFFEHISALIQTGTHKIGLVFMSYLQFTGATFLSAILDNNIVADFAGRAIRGIELGTLHLFALSQIAGYATGGCWTHIGSAQSVVAYAFIRREVDEAYTPFRWIKAMTPIILEIFVLMSLIIYGEALLLKYFVE
ncbi:MAG TPA: hypothetical protein DF383_03450 [Deltaproteobacteria bacterium]|nr:hypothetical protein [Deltaproteobacteria bacterium]